MCRNIRPLFNFDPPATDDEINKASIQFIRKVSGFTKPSKANEEIFMDAVEKISENIKELLNNLVTNAKPKNREEETEKLHLKNEKRFGSKNY